MRCLSCKTNYVSKEYNKLVYLKLTEGNCIISCIDNLFLTKEIECVSTCPFGTYEYIPNNTCVDECPSSFIIIEEKQDVFFLLLKTKQLSLILKKLFYQILMIS